MGNKKYISSQINSVTFYDIRDFFLRPSWFTSLLGPTSDMVGWAYKYFFIVNIIIITMPCIVLSSIK